MTMDELQRARRVLGYSYKELAEKAGLPLSTVQKIFSGATKSPKYSTMSALERVLLYPEDLPRTVSLPDRLFHYDAAQHPANTTDLTCPMVQEPADLSHSMIQDPSVQYGTAVKEKQQGEYTVEDYLALPDDVRYELIDGVLIKMEAPSRRHQSIAGYLFYKIYSFIEESDGSCTPYIAPLDVQLDKDNRTMVQPDVMIVCDHDVETDKRLFGAPDFVAEVLSPSTRRKDMGKKLNKYMDAGVREYWVIDPELLKVIVYQFGPEESDISFAGYSMQDDIPIGIYDGKCVINFSRVI